MVSSKVIRCQLRASGVQIHRVDDVAVLSEIKL